MSNEKGFFFLRKNIYYGSYPKQHISGRINISAVKPEIIKTDVPFAKDEVAFSLCDNHAFAEPEYIWFEQGLEKIFKCLGITRDREIDFSKTEERLGISLPQEIKILYSFLNAASVFTEGTERFMSLDKLEIDGDNLVFYKIRRTPVGLSLKDGSLMSYHKGNWEYNAGGENFFYAMNRVVVKAICSMPFNREGKVKGAIRVALSPDNMLSSAFEGLLEILPEYKTYGNIVLINESGALGWYLHNGFSSNILVGCKNEELFEKILGVKLEVNWSKASLKNI